MLKVLFSPSESKREGGVHSVLDESCFIFPKLFDTRMEIFSKYESYVSSAKIDELERLFGIKERSEIERCVLALSSKSLLKAVERYDGVAYKHLGYETLCEQSRSFVDKNTLIFSNLFGVIGAADLIPSYKLKQGESFLGLKLEECYRDTFSKVLDEMLDGAFILDLRAGYYDKFYKPKGEYTTLKFLKEGRVVSHYAKAYRGVLLRQVAQNLCQNRDDFLSLVVSDLKLVDMKKIGKKEEILFEIMRD